MLVIRTFQSLIAILVPLFAVGQCSPSLFFSEYVEGSSFNKCIEIYNPTGATVDLDDYVVYIYANENTMPTSTIALSGMLMDGGTHVVCDNGANTTFMGIADQIDNNVNFNGNDAIALALEADDSIIDLFGTIGENPSTNWNCDGSPRTVDQTLVRQPNVFTGNPDGFTTTDDMDDPDTSALCTEWIEFPQDFSDSLGSHFFQDPTINNCAFEPPMLGDTAICDGESLTIDLADQMLPVEFSSIFTEDFEGDTSYITTIEEFIIGDDNYFKKTDGSELDSRIEYTNRQGDFFFGAMDIDGGSSSGGPEEDSASLIIEGIDIDNQENLLFTVLLAEDPTGSTQSWDPSDSVRIMYRIDGGSYEPLLYVSTSDGNNSAPALDLDFDGVGEGPILTGAFTPYSAIIPDTGDVLDIAILITVGDNDVDIAIDSIDVSVGNAPITSFNFYAEDPACGGELLLGNAKSYTFSPSIDDSPVSLFVTTTNGICETPAAEMEITVNPTPEITASAADSIVCVGDDIQLMGMSTVAGSFIWTGPADFMSNMENPVISDAQLENTGIYTLIVSTDNMCADTSSVKIGIVNDIQPPEIEIVAACNDGEAIIIPPVTLADVSGSANDLFISEYVEGTNQNKCLEIFNGTGDTLDLGNYIIQIFFNGNTTPGASLELEGELLDGATYVICDPDADAQFTDVADHITNVATNFNGNDAIVLLKNGSAIDVIGQIGNDPGDAWTGAGTSTMDQTLIRMPIITSGDSIGNDAFDPSEEWVNTGEDNASNLGNHVYTGLVQDTVLFNFYSENPDINMAAMPLPGGEGVASYDAGGPGIFFVTSVLEGCESAAVEVEVIVSEGITQFSCSKINLSLGSDCSLAVDPTLFIDADIRSEFLVVEIQDENGNFIPLEDLSEIPFGVDRTYRIRDFCTDQSCWNTYTLEDKNPPIIEVEDMEALCGEDISVEEIGGFTISDCVDFTFDIRDRNEGDYCDGDRAVIRTITAKDAFGNAHSVEQRINIISPSIDDITPPNDSVVTDCDRTSPAEIADFNGVLEDGFPVYNGMPLDTGVFCNISIWYEEKSIDKCEETCGFNSVILRTWKLLDWCEEVPTVVEYPQIISAKDRTPPVLIAPISPIIINTDPWSCKVDKIDLPRLAFTENCSGFVTQEVTGPAGIGVSGLTIFHAPVGTHTFNYRGIDCCGNISSPVPVTVIIRDNTPPIAITKEEVVVSLGVSPNDDDREVFLRMYPESIDNFSTDNCGIETYLIRRDGDPCRTDSDEYGPYIDFCCRDAGRTFDVWLMVIDSSGNRAEQWGRVTVEDKGLVIECPDIFAECHEDIDDVIRRSEKPTVTTLNCADRGPRLRLVDMDESNYNALCGYGEIYLRYEERGNPDLFCIQTLFVNYKGGFSCESIYWPDSFRYTDCIEDSVYVVEWDAGPCQLIGYNMTSDTFQFETDACSKIINQHTVIDWCIYDQFAENPSAYPSSSLNCNDFLNDEVESENGVYTFTEIIKVVDTIAPIIAACPIDTLNILNSNCTLEISLSNEAFDPSVCPRKPLRWQLLVTDEDGRVYEYNARGNSAVAVTFTLNNIPFEGPMATYDVVWKVWDGCGNTDFCETTLTIIDRKPPTPYCREVSSALMQNGLLEIWARDLNLASFDNCYIDDSLRFTFMSISPDTSLLYERHYFDKTGAVMTEDTTERYESGMLQLWLPELRSSAKILTCSDFPESTQQMSVWDDKWNVDYCQVLITLTDSDGACGSSTLIQGQTTMVNGAPLAPVVIEAMDFMGVKMMETTSDVEGNYAFAGTGSDFYGELIASTRLKPEEAWTTLDVLMLQQHILNRSPLDNPYKVIAGDVNLDNQLSALDMLYIQRRVVGISDFLPSTDWQFVVKDETMTIHNALETKLNALKLDETNSMPSTDFVGIVMGDLNIDAEIQRSNSPNVRQRQTDIIQLSMSESHGFITSSKDIIGLQFAIDVGQTIDIKPLGNARILTQRQEDVVLISLTSSNRIEAGTPLLELVVESPLQLEELSLAEGFIKNESYSHIDAEPHDLVFTKIADRKDFTVEQNVPNPFNFRTSITYTIPTDGEIEFIFYALDGKVLWSQTTVMGAGTHSIEVDKMKLGVRSGVVLYECRYNEDIAMGKMILIE